MTAALALSATAAFADDGATVSSSVEPFFDGGELAACQIVFDVAHKNAEYFGSDVALLDGSVLIMGKKGQVPTVLLKLGVAKTSGGTAGQFVAPSNVYLVDGLQTNTNDYVQQIEGETPGHALFLYRLDARTLGVMKSGLTTGKFKMAYSMGGGSTGSTFAFDINVSKDDGTLVSDPSAVGKLQDCVRSLPFMQEK